MSCKICFYFKDNNDYLKYLAERLNAGDEALTLYEELKAFEDDFEFSLADLTSHKDKCDLTQHISNNGANDFKDEDKRPLIDIDFDSLLDDFNKHNLVKKQDICNELLTEISYKILNIINGKIDAFKDKVPKDDIQSLKIINDMIEKVHVENSCNSPLIYTHQMQQYGNLLINKLIQSKYLSKDDAFNLIKMTNNKDIHHSVFKFDHKHKG